MKEKFQSFFDISVLLMRKYKNQFKITPSFFGAGPVLHLCQQNDKMACQHMIGMVQWSMLQSSCGDSKGIYFFFLENKNVYLSYLITIIITSTSTIVLFLTLLTLRRYRRTCLATHVFGYFAPLCFGGPPTMSR